MINTNRKVIIVSTYCVPRIGGGETHILQLGSYLRKNSIDTNILTLNIGKSRDKEIVENVPIFRFGNINCIKEKKRGYEEIKNYVLKNVGTISHLYLLFGVGPEYTTKEIVDLIEIGNSKGIPVILRISSSGRVTELNNVYPELVERFRLADAYISLNSGIKKELIKVGVDKDKIFSIYNGTNTNEFYPPDKKLSNTGIANPKTFLSVSRLSTKKNVPLLITVWGNLINRNKLGNSKLLIVGDDRFEHNKNSISNEISKILKNSTFHKSIQIIHGVPHKYIAKYYQCADIFVSLSIQEGMSNSILEAMSSGLFVIAPKTQASKVLLQNKKNGLLFKMNNKELETSIVRAFKMSNRKIRNVGMLNRKKIIERFDLDIMGKKFIKLFNNLTKNIKE